MRSFDHSSSEDRSGFTLLEVVIGTVLLASLVAGVLMSMGAHQKKLHFARQKSIAVQAADELLMTWDQSQTGVPLRAVGAMAGGRMSWQTAVIDSRLLCNIPIHVVRLSVFANRNSSHTAQQTALCQIDVVVDAARDASGAVQ